MNTIQATLGGVLLLLAGFAVILLAFIFLLLEVNLILRLGGKLIQRWSEGRPARNGSRPSPDSHAAKCASEHPGAR